MTAESTRSDVAPSAGIPDWLDELCNRLAGGEGVKEICADPHMPVNSTVYATMARNPEVKTRIARAREAQQDAEADKMIEMADEATADNWQVVRLRIWARQWRAAKLAPKTFGDRQVLAGDPDAPLVVDTPERSLKERARGAAFLFAKNQKAKTNG